MRSLLAAIAAVCMCYFGTACASSNTSEITDMWWNPAESGWGVNVIPQNDVAFITFFVYDTAKNPKWYTAQLAYQGNFVWSGPLYATTGPWYGGAFPPSGVTIRQAGSATFASSSLTSATLTYSVDGVNVNKALQRQTWTNEDFRGFYAGGYSIRLSNCSPSSLNGIQEEAGYLSVSQSGSNITMSSQVNGPGCTFGGQYTQYGKLGQVQGSYSCTDGTRGTFLMYELTPTVSGFNGRLSGSNQYCQWSGYVGGINRAN